MVAIWITDAREPSQAEAIVSTLREQFPDVKTSFGLDSSPQPFPCGHPILRAEGGFIDTQQFISIVTHSGFACWVLEDKVCK